MALLTTYIVPHPPLAVAEVGRGQEKEIPETMAAFRRVAEEIRDLRPDTVVIVSPHNRFYREGFHISTGTGWQSSFRDFQTPEPQIRMNYDTELIEQIGEAANEAGIPVGSLPTGRDSDHGSLVPLYFLAKAENPEDDKQILNLTPEVVRLSISGFDHDTHMRFGQILGEIFKEADKRIVFMASGDLSHRLKEDGPYGLSPDAPTFEEDLIEALRTGDLEHIVRFDPDLCDEVGECGVRGFCMLAGILKDTCYESELLSHEDTFGVGYAVARFRPLPEKNKREQNPYVALARQALETRVVTGNPLEIQEIPDTMQGQRAGCFVSLHTTDGELRGCIGTLAPTTPNLAYEIAQNAVSAGLDDPRFPAVRPNELSELNYKVDVLGKPEPIRDHKDLDEKRYGVIVSNGHRRGVLLPDLAGVDSVDEQIRIALQKAGIRPNETYKIERFTVTRYQEEN